MKCFIHSLKCPQRRFLIDTMKNVMNIMLLHNIDEMLTLYQ